MPTLETTRGSMYVADYRRPLTNSMPTLLIHGAGGIHLDMPLALRRATLQSVAPDLCGHGRSSGNGRTRIEEYALDMIAVLDALDIPQANVLGHSMGGAIALMVALSDPQRVERLILIGTAPVIPVNPRIIAGFGEEAAATIETIVKWMWRRFSPVEALAGSVERMQQTDPNVIAGDYIACNQFNVAHLLPTLNVPSLILHGIQDRMIPITDARAMAAAIPRATLLEYADGGHMIHLEEPDRISADIMRWLEMPSTDPEQAC